MIFKSGMEIVNLRQHVKEYIYKFFDPVIDQHLNKLTPEKIEKFINLYGASKGIAKNLKSGPIQISKEEITMFIAAMLDISILLSSQNEIPEGIDAGYKQLLDSIFNNLDQDFPDDIDPIEGEEWKYN